MTMFHPFLWLSSIPLCVYMYHIFFIYSPFDAHLGFLLFLAIMNSVAMNMSVQMSLEHSDFISLGDIYPVVVLLDHMLIPFLRF